ncbi:MAG: septum formation initiator family protein [Acidimicrobiales bacterium]|nr:septum formation initiator family protein [Acidimicrobiales bacterium]
MSLRRGERPVDDAGEARNVGRLVRRLGAPLLAGVAVALVIVGGLFPTRTYLAKRQEVAEAEARLAGLEADNASLQARVEALDSDTEIERLAREDYGLVKPGEEVYRVVPPPQDPVEIPQVWPFNQLRDDLDD